MKQNTKIRDIDVLKTFTLQNTLNYTRYFFKKKTNNKFIISDHHRIVCGALDRVVSGEIKKLIINIAPRYSKTELVVKNFISYGLALNPKSKFIHLSYSDDLVLDNSKEINSIVSSPDFQMLYEARPSSVNSRKWYTAQGGGLYAISSAGQVTGFGAGVVDPDDLENKDADDSDMEEFCPAFDSTFAGAIIIDDPIKPDDALSDTVREKVNNKFETTIRNRVNSRNTPIIIIMQRLHEHDLCGYLNEIEPGEWTTISLPCLTVDDEGNEKALWPHKHTVEELYKIKNANSFVFETQYQQNPKPLEGLMYDKGFKEYDIIPVRKNSVRKNYTDTADTGSDFLCSIDYIEMDDANYIIDVLYTQKPMEYTEVKTAEMLTKDKIQFSNIESNNGGRSFSRAVQSQCREMKNYQTRIESFYQSENKNVRIFTRSAAVQNLSIFPKGWDKLWPAFYKAITSYMKSGNNKHDDAPDALTGTVEKREGFKTADLESVLGMLP